MMRAAHEEPGNAKHAAIAAITRAQQDLEHAVMQLDLLPGHTVETETYFTLRPKHGMRMVVRAADPARSTGAAVSASGGDAAA